MNLSQLDIDAYAEICGEQSVHKNLTIPAWLNPFSEKNNINFSQILQNALLGMAHARKELHKWINTIKDGLINPLK